MFCTALFLLKRKHNLNKTHLKKLCSISHKFLHTKIVTFCGNVSVFPTFNCGFDSIRIVQRDE